MGRVDWFKEMPKRCHCSASKAVHNICTGSEFWIYAYEPERGDGGLDRVPFSTARDGGSGEKEANGDEEEATDGKCTLLRCYSVAITSSYGERSSLACHGYVFCRQMCRYPFPPTFVIVKKGETSGRVLWTLKNLSFPKAKPAKGKRDVRARVLREKGRIAGTVRDPMVAIKTRKKKTQRASEPKNYG
ncbi:hypothetical protein Trydic_g21142 [Trypoxylus dichotomus]